MEHAARSIVGAADRALGLPLGEAFAEVDALTAALRLAEGRMRDGEHVDERWIASHEHHLHRSLDELAGDDSVTTLGRRLLDRLDDRATTTGIAR